MITIRYLDLLLTILTACACVLTVGFVVAWFRARRSLDRLDRLLAELSRVAPEMERIARSSEAASLRFQEVSDSVAHVLDDVGTVTAEARAMAMPLIHELRNQADAVQASLHQASAVVAGTKAGFAAFRRSTRRVEPETEDHENHEHPEHHPGRTKRAG